MPITWTNRRSGDPLYLSLAGGTLTLSFAGRTNLSFDGEGRLVGAWLEGITYRRGLDSRVLMKWQDGGRRRRRLLEEGERRALFERIHAAAAQTADDLRSGVLAGTGRTAAAAEEAAALLVGAAGWDAARLEAEADRFAAVYKPVSILPPDQYLALVLQAAEGCSYNRCTFCTFYRDRPFRIKDEAEFEIHVREVQALLGAGMSLRRTLFLADANAVMMPEARLAPLLALANRAFPIRPRRAAVPPAERAGSWHLDGIYAFISAPDVLRKRADEFAALRDQNVVRLYVGLETGHDPLRAFLRKEGSAEDAAAAVRTIKAGGLSVGLIVLVGAGGAPFAAAHRRETVALVERLPLDRRDLVYFSPFVPAAGSPYLHDAEAAGLPALGEEELAAEEASFRAALASWAAGRGVRLSHYDVREFIY